MTLGQYSFPTPVIALQDSIAQKRYYKPNLFICMLKILQYFYYLLQGTYSLYFSNGR